MVSSARVLKAPTGLMVPLESLVPKGTQELRDHKVQLVPRDQQGRMLLCPLASKWGLMSRLRYLNPAEHISPKVMPLP
jgi:hypothetical protein